MMKHKKSSLSLLIILIALLWIPLAITYFTYTLNNIQLEEQHKNLEEITKSNAIEVEYTVEKYVQVLSAAAAFIETYEDITSADVMTVLRQIVKENDFTRLAIDFTNNTSITSDGKQINISTFDYSDQIKKGEPFILDVVSAVVDGTPCISIVVPLKDKDGSFYAALRGTITTDKFSTMLEETFSKGGGYFYIVDKTGNYIAKSQVAIEILPEDKNYFSTIENFSFAKGYTADQIKTLFTQKQGGFSRYAYEGEERYCYFQPTNVNQWMVMTIVPKAIVENNVYKHVANVLLLIGQLTIVFCLFLLYIYRTQKNAKQQQKRNQEQLTKLAYYDEFSGAPTLLKFKIDAQAYIDAHKNKTFLLVKLDVKEFKLVNQILGEAVGNQVILNIVKALKANTAKDHTLYARLHDDEFLVLHTYETESENLALKESFRLFLYRFMGEDFTYNLKIVSGHYYMTEDGCYDIAQAIEKANIAHGMAKHRGQTICIYDQAFTLATLKQKELEGRAQKAIENFEFKVFLQPKYELENETVIGAEALVRWIDDQQKITFPNDFIPIFEQNGFITVLDFYMFEETCKIIHDWMEQGLQPVPVSVNFSRLHLFDPKFLITLAQIANKHNVPTCYLEIELTETVVMDVQHDLTSLIKALHAYGFQVSMDDFGTGYSSLGMLKNLNVDSIKLDRSFFLEAHENARAHSILSNMLNMSIDLGIKTVAEGVEEQEHVDLLRKLNCDMIQGYFFSKPMPAAEFTKTKLTCPPSEVLHSPNEMARRFNLRKNNELLTDMLDSMPLAFALWNQEGEIVQCNKETAILFGFVEEEDFIANWENIIFRPVTQYNKTTLSLKDHILQAFAHGQIQPFTWTFADLNGSPLPCEVVLVRIVNKGTYMVACYIRDMRLQLEAENNIREDHSKLQAITNEYKQLLDHTPLCINIWNKDTLIMCNKAVCAMFGIESEDVYRDRFHDFSPEYQPDGKRSREKVAQNFKYATEKGTHTFFWMHLKNNGDPLPVEITLVRITINGEEMVAAFVRDISLQLETENAIKEEYMKLKTMMDASPLCFTLWDEQMRNTMCNQAAIDLFELNSEEEYLTKFFALSPEKQPDGSLSTQKVQQCIQQAFDTGNCVYQWMHQKLNGEEIPAEITLNRIELNGNPFIAGFTRDLRSQQEES